MLLTNYKGILMILREIMQITGELKDFTQKWASRDSANEGNAYAGNLRYFPWEKFFSSVPKL